MSLLDLIQMVGRVAEMIPPAQPRTAIPMETLLTLARQRREMEAPSLASSPGAKPRSPGRPFEPTSLSSSARLAEAYRQAGYRVLDEYTSPTPQSTGGHLHVEWEPGRDRQQVARLLTEIAGQLGYKIRVGGWGTGPPHKGRGHKESRALDIVLR